MSWEDDTLADGAPFHGGEESPTSQEVETTAPPATEDDSSTQPAGEPEVPFHQHPRWIERQQQLQALQAEVDGYKPLADYREEIAAYQAAGISPDLLRLAREQMANPPQQQPPAPATPPDPEQAFTDWANEKLAPHGINVFDLAPDALINLQVAYQGDQVQQQLAQQRQAIERREQEAQARTEWAEVQTKFPYFKDAPGLQRALGARWEAGEGSMATIAAEIDRDIQTFHQQAQAEYLQGKQADSRVPVTAGGSAPPPYTQGKSVHDMAGDEAEAFMLSGILAAQPPL